MQHVWRAFDASIPQFEKFLKIQDFQEATPAFIHYFFRLPSSQNQSLTICGIFNKSMKKLYKNERAEKVLAVRYHFVFNGLMVHIFPFALNGWKILCASIKWRIKQTSPRCLSIFSFLHNISWATKTMATNLFNWNWNFSSMKNENWNCGEKRENIKMAAEIFHT